MLSLVTVCLTKPLVKIFPSQKKKRVKYANVQISLIKTEPRKTKFVIKTATLFVIKTPLMV